MRELVPSAKAPDTPEALEVCTSGILTAALTRRDDGLPDALLIPPMVPEATEWRLTGRAYFGGRITEVALAVEGAPPWALSFPEELWFDEAQGDALTTLRLELEPYAADGEGLDLVEVEELWLVWPDGPTAEPLLLDAAGRQALAPGGALSGDAALAGGE